MKKKNKPKPNPNSPAAVLSQGLGLIGQVLSRGIGEGKPRVKDLRSQKTIPKAISEWNSAVELAKDIKVHRKAEQKG